MLLPSALVGGALAAYAGDGVISLGSLVGFLTVLGISARNGSRGDTFSQAPLYARARARVHGAATAKPVAGRS